MQSFGAARYLLGMTFDYDRLLWDPFAEDFFKQQKHFDHVSKIDIVEYEPGQQPKIHTSLNDKDFNSWLDLQDSVVASSKQTATGQISNSSEASSSPKLQIIFIDHEKEHAVNNYQAVKLCITPGSLRRTFQAFNVCQHFTRSISEPQVTARRIHRNLSGDIHRHEFWSAVIHKSDPDMHTLFSWKSVPKFSRLVVWCAHDFSSENVTILALRLPTTVKNRILYGSSELFGEIISHPILAHLLMIQGLDFNHSMSTKYLGQALLREEERIKSSVAECTDSSERFLRICRYLSSLNLDNWLAQETVERLIRENEWKLHHFKPSTSGLDPGVHKQKNEIIDRALRDVLEKLKMNAAYTKTCEERARINVDECRARITHIDAEINLSLAQESKALADAAKMESRAVAKLQYLAMSLLPLSLASGIFGTGFFSTSAGPDGGPQLLISPQWWWLLVLAIPLTILTYLIMYFLGTWRAISRSVSRNGSRSEESHDEAKRGSLSYFSKIRSRGQNSVDLA